MVAKSIPLLGCRVAFMRWLGHGPGEEVLVGGNRSSGVSLPVPRCLTIETFWFRRDILVPIKFSQGRRQDHDAIVAQLSGAGYSLGKYHPPLRVIVVIRT